MSAVARCAPARDERPASGELISPGQVRPGPIHNVLNKYWPGGRRVCPGLMAKGGGACDPTHVLTPGLLCVRVEFTLAQTFELFSYYNLLIITSAASLVESWP